MRPAFVMVVTRTWPAGTCSIVNEPSVRTGTSGPPLHDSSRMGVATTNAPGTGAPSRRR